MAARAAVVLDASELVLLKSVTIMEPYDWTEAARRGMRCERLDLRNSGDTAGDRNRVVGYGAFALREAA